MSDTMVELTIKVVNYSDADLQYDSRSSVLGGGVWVLEPCDIPADDEGYGLCKFYARPEPEGSHLAGTLTYNLPGGSLNLLFDRPKYSATSSSEQYVVNAYDETNYSIENGSFTIRYEVRNR
ncbi:hypothetical protein [Tumebacillus lipolyticus]|uniref:Uncharacterized protein n=1 Tax=Tumebacillus lipolyticus TaxID=1280370 RepID=A0ABW4ZXX8_9BACL